MRCGRLASRMSEKAPGTREREAVSDTHYCSVHAGPLHSSRPGSWGVTNWA